MKTSKKYFILPIGAIYLLTLMSCEKTEFLDKAPHDSFTTDTYFNSENSVLGALTNCYINAFTFEPWSDETASDNSYGQYDWFSPPCVINNGTVRPNSAVVDNIWSGNYTTIRSTNIVLENIDKVNFTDENLKKRIQAEARAIRAWSYLNLAFNFGNVPIITELLDVTESKEVSPSSQQEVYDFITQELTAISNDLPVSYDEANSARITRGASYALKARTYLFQNNYEKVLESVGQIESLGIYNLYTGGSHPYDDLFSGANQRNEEVIFSVHRMEKQGKLSIGHSANSAFLLHGIGASDPYFTIFATGSLADAYPMKDGRLIHEAGSSYDPTHPYDNRDPRLGYTMFYPGSKYPTLVNGQIVFDVTYDPEDENNPLAATSSYSYVFGSRTGLLWRKYTDLTVWGFNNVWDNQNDIILMRYADVMLMKAEALAEINGVSMKDEIIDLIDNLRQRAGGGNVHRENYNSQEDLIKLVRNERRIELANEGLRYYDIIRWRIAEDDPVTTGHGLNGELYGAYMRLDGDSKDSRTTEIDGVARRYIMTNTFDKSKRYLLPIPQRELDLNSNLVQNHGW